MEGALSTVLQSSTVERHSGLATGFDFTEGPLGHADGFSYGVDICYGRLLRWQAGKGSRWCGSIYFTATGMRMPLEGRDVESSPVFRVAPDGSRVMATAECEYPNGLAFSPS